MSFDLTRQVVRSYLCCLGWARRRWMAPSGV